MSNSNTPSDSIELVEKPRQFTACIHSIDADTFHVRIRELEVEDAPEIELDLPVERLKPEDKAQIEVGRVFTWTLVGLDKPLEIEFRPLIIRTDEEIMAIEEEVRATAAEWMAMFDNPEVIEA